MIDAVPVSRRLADLRKRAGYSVRDFAREMGFGDRFSTYSSYERDTYKKPLLPVELATKAATILAGKGSPPIAEEEVLMLAGITGSRSGTSPSGQSHGRGRDAADWAPDTLIVREYDVAAAAGSGALPVLDGNGEAELVAEWVVPRDFLPPHYRNSTVAIIRVQGDSMAPEIMPEERVMVDTSQTWVGPEGIYITWNGIGVVVKRLQVVPGEVRKIRFISRNPAYAPYEQPADEVRVLGRVIGRWEWK